MMERGIIHFVLLMMTVTVVHLETSLDRIIVRCVEQSEQFAETEEKYVDTHKVTPDEPNVDSPQNPEIKTLLYDKEKQQRPFECITDRTDNYSLADLERNPYYQALVHECKSKQQQPLCDPTYPYRTYDGTCNNLRNPKYGSVLACLRRFTKQNYRGAAGIRQSVCGKPLPEPRFLSLNIFKDVNKPNRDVTHMASLFGQFFAHDITDVPNTYVDGKPINCCPDNTTELHPQCIPIYVKKNDPFYSKHNITCFNFKRASLCDTCSVGKRKQMNEQTAYIDLSMIYGTSESSARDLRANDGSGKLRIQKNKRSGDLMPLLGVERYFKSGDRRVNQHTTLIALHTLFLREHNRIVEELSCINPHWNGEKLYQEARRINIAQYQSIVYKEHLPVIIGPNLMTRFDLWVSVSGSGRTIYDPFLDATIFVEFNTAAYRLHSTINKIMTNCKVDKCLRLFRNTSTNPIPLYHDQMASLMEGVCKLPAQSYDRSVAIDITDFLYKEVPGSYGFDIVSFNVQRGRDNGLPTYTEMVHLLSKGTINIQSFDDLHVLMDEESIELLRKSYCHVKDIDLWVGLNNEKVEENNFVGPTAAEVNAFQFRNLKFGDRFYFEHFGNFNDEQLRSLTDVTLSSLLCSNTKIEEIQLNVHRFPSKTNPVMWCRDVPKVDLSYWTEISAMKHGMSHNP